MITKESYWAATLMETDRVVELEALYDFDYLDGKATATLAVGNPQTGDWASSASTKDWPYLDVLFGGRKNWQKFLAEKSQEATEEMDNE